MRSLSVATFKFGLLTIRWYSATGKRLFSYPQGDRSVLRKPKKDRLPPVRTGYLLVIKGQVKQHLAAPKHGPKTNKNEGTKFEHFGKFYETED